jgi:hypothetical protein
MSTALHAAAQHEARHAGYLHNQGIRIKSITIRDNGSGETRLTLHSREELARIHDVDPAIAVGMLTAYITGALVGIDDDEELPADDQRMAHHWIMFYTEVTGRDAGPVLERCELRGRAWVLRNYEPVESFARQLVYHRHLAGEPLERQLCKWFRQEREPIPMGEQLGPWIEEKRQVKRKAEAERSARVMDAYMESMGCANISRVTYKKR